jgi:hypothetical protein
MYVIFNEHYIKGTLLPALKGNNSCKAYNFRIKFGNVQSPLPFLLLLYGTGTSLSHIREITPTKNVKITYNFRIKSGMCQMVY